MYSLMGARSTHIPCAIMKDCATHAYLPVSQVRSLSKSTPPLLVGEETAPLPTFLFITAAGAPHPSILSLVDDLTSKVMCQSRHESMRMQNHRAGCDLRALAARSPAPSQEHAHAG